MTQEMINHYFSISQFKLARTCLRRWWLEYVVDVPPDYEDAATSELETQYFKGVLYSSTLIDAHDPHINHAICGLVKKTEKDLDNINFKFTKRELILLETNYRGVPIVCVDNNAAIGVLYEAPCIVDFILDDKFIDIDYLQHDLRIIFYAYFSDLNLKYILFHQAVPPQIHAARNESPQDFATRFVEKSKSQINIIDVSKLISKRECEEILDELMAPCLDTLKSKRVPNAIQTPACYSSGKQCPYWSYCFGCNRGTIS